MASSSTTNTDREEEESLYETWMNLHHEELRELKQAASQARDNKIDDQKLTQLIEKIINHFQDYTNNRSRLARIDVSPFFAPTKCTPLENSLLWIGGCRPSSFIRLIYALCGMEIEFHLTEFLQGTKIGGLGELTTKQMSMIDELQGRTIKEENNLYSKMASLQEDIIDQPLTSKMRKDDNELVKCEDADEPLDKHSQDMANVMEEADELRMTTMKQIVGLLKPAQAVEYLAAAKKIRLCVQQWGEKKDHAHTNKPSQLLL